MSDNKNIFVKNKRRALNSIVGRDAWIPEHERLNMKPINSTDVSEDFMNQKRRNSPIGSRKPPARTRLVASGPGAGQDQAWLPPNTGQIRERDFSDGDITDGEILSPPVNRFENTYRSMGVDLTNVDTGQYCIIYDGEVWSSDSREDIEAAVERIISADPEVSNSELMVLKRLNIRVGALVEE